MAMLGQYKKKGEGLAGIFPLGVKMVTCDLRRGVTAG